MARTLSIFRRKPGLVHVFLPSRPDIAAYRFEAASNFDQAFTLFETVPTYGKKSLSVPDIGNIGSQYRGQTHFLFNPADYIVAVPAVDDTKPFFIRIAQVSNSGVVSASEAMHMVLPPLLTPNRTLTLSGTATLTVTEIQLPMLCNNMRFQNNGANNLLVSTELNGAQSIIPPISTSGINLTTTYENVSQLFVSSAAGTTTFNALFALRNNPTS